MAQLRALLIGLSLSLSGGMAAAQSRAAAQGSVTIVDPPQMGQQSELRLRPVAVPRAGAGVTAEALAGRYSVAGQAGDTFNIAVPTTLRLVRSGGTEEVQLTLRPSGSVSSLAGAYGAPASGEFGVDGQVGVTRDTTAGLYQGAFAVILSLQ